VRCVKIAHCIRQYSGSSLPTCGGKSLPACGGTSPACGGKDGPPDAVALDLERPGFVSLDEAEGIGEADKSTDDAVERAGLLEVGEFAQRSDDDLLDPSAFAAGLDDLEVLMGGAAVADRFGADEHDITSIPCIGAMSRENPG